MSTTRTNLVVPTITEGFLERWCETMSFGTESHEASHIGTGLAMLSATVGPRMGLMFGPMRIERLNLFILTVGQSALSRKTTGLSGLRQMVNYARSDGSDLVRAINVSRMSDAGIIDALDVVTQDTEAEVARLKKNAKRGATIPDVDEVHRPVPLAWVAMFNEISALWDTDPSGWVVNAQKALLNIYDGSLESVTKGTRVPQQECFVVAIGNITPRVLSEQTSLQMIHTGFVGRFLVVPSPPPEKPISIPMWNDAAKHLMDVTRSDVDSLMDLAKDAGETPIAFNNGSQSLYSKDAAKWREEWYSRHWKTYVESSADDALSVAAAEVWGRFQTTHLKVATLAAVGRQLDSIGSLQEVRVEAEDMEWGASIIENASGYLIDSLRDAGADSDLPMGKVEQRVLRYLEKRQAHDETTAISIAEVCKGVKGGKVSYGMVRQACQQMEGDHIGAEARGRGHYIWLTN